MDREEQSDQDDERDHRESLTSGKAIGSFILGFPSLCIPLLPFAGLALGIVALVEINRGSRRRRAARKGQGLAIAGIVMSSLGLVTSTVVVLSVLLLPAAQKLHEVAGRIQGQNTKIESQRNLKQLGLAMFFYHDSYGRLPPAVVYSRDGKPLYSWRVLVLPYLEQQTLYTRFHLDEAWDSPHNLPLLEEMPKVFADPGHDAAAPYATHYQVIDGPGAAFDSAARVSMRLVDFTDGTANTLMIVEAESPVPWSKPQDASYRKGAIPALGGVYPDGFNAAFADGSVHFIPKSTSQEIIEALITRAGGEIVPPGAVP